VKWAPITDATDPVGPAVALSDLTCAAPRDLSADVLRARLVEHGADAE